MASLLALALDESDSATPQMGGAVVETAAVANDEEADVPSNAGVDERFLLDRAL